MANRTINVRDPQTAELIPIKLLDNGDGSYSVGGESVLASGTLTTSSASVPADTGRAEATHFWDGCLIRMTSGALAGQVRKITTFTTTTGVFTLAAAFTAVPGLSNYVILAFQ